MIPWQMAIEGIWKLNNDLWHLIFWPRMRKKKKRKDVKQHVQNCLFSTKISTKHNHYQYLIKYRRTYLLISSWVLPNQMDMHDTILVVLNNFSKYNHFIALSHPFTAKNVAGTFCKEMISLHGMPRPIFSNHEFLFINVFGKDCFGYSKYSYA